MQPSRGLLQERLENLKEIMPLKDKVRLEVFDTFYEADQFSRRETGYGLQHATGFATGWDETRFGGEEKVGIIGIILEEWPKYADTVEDVDGVLAEEYFHVDGQLKQPFQLCVDGDYADYVALTAAMEKGLVCEIASYNLKHIEDETAALVAATERKIRLEPDDCVNDLARAAALLHGKSPPAYEKTAAAVARKADELMETYFRALPAYLLKAFEPKKALLLSEKAYSSSEATESVKRRL
jgi:hypothetical protein